MSGALWALSAGLGFGLFQTLNRRAVRGMGVLVATFLQLFISAVVLAGAAIATEDVSQLLTAPASAWLNFALAGLMHFFIGWTFINASQKRIGAARTSSLIATTPLFAAVIAALTLQETPTLATIIAIPVIVTGVYLVNEPKQSTQEQGGLQAPPNVGWLRSIAYGLAAPFMWSLSPIFIRRGLEDLSSPLLGVTVGIGFSAAAYGVLLAIRRMRAPLGEISLDSIVFKLVAGVLVGLSTWMRWIALDLAPVALVLAISQVSVPVVIILSPLVVGKGVERVTWQIWLGSSLVVGGCLVLILS